MWTPFIGRTYGVLPWQMSRLTPREWREIVRDVKQMDKEARQAARSR